MRDEKKAARKKLIPSMFTYRFTRFGTWFIAKYLFRRKYMRNELKRAKGPAIVLANHQAALDFANLINASKSPINIIVSNSFFNTLPIKGAMAKIGVIPKQQFQTSMQDLSRMREVIDNGGILGMYPAGLMCEDGISTPIPAATYRFIQWFNADIYIARSYGTYFCKPKWAKKIRPGRTYLDVYKLCDKEQLHKMTADEFKAKCEEALLFDAYREQEKLLIKYKRGDNVEGLENVLYTCPHCKREFTIAVRDKSTLFCTECGYAEKSDAHAFLHKISEVGKEIRYVSDWNRIILDDVREKIDTGALDSLSSATKIHMIDMAKKKFVEVGDGTVSIAAGRLTLTGTVKSEPLNIDMSASAFPSLPFKAGVCFEIQHGEDIYRCVLEDGRLTMKFINMIKTYYEKSQKS